MTKHAGRLVRRRAAAQLLRLVCVELAGPLVDLLSGFRFRHAIAFLNLASQHLDIALICSTSLCVSLPHSWRTLPLNCFQLPWILSRKELSVTFGSPFVCFAWMGEANGCFYLPPFMNFPNQSRQSRQERHCHHRIGLGSVRLQRGQAQGPTHPTRPLVPTGRWAPCGPLMTGFGCQYSSRRDDY